MTGPRGVPEPESRDGAWRDRAACRGMDSAIFFVERGAPADQARLVCDRCSVQRDCLDFALDHAEPYGIWGGKSVYQRQQLIQVRAESA